MELIFSHENWEIPLEVRYGKRKTLNIAVAGPDWIVVWAPHDFSSELLMEIVMERSAWIISKLNKYKNIEHLLKAKQFITGEDFLFLGKKYRLELLTSPNLRKSSVELTGERLQIKTGQADRASLKMLIEAWYRQQAAEIINQRAEYFMKDVSYKPKIIRVKDQRKRWGSCSNRGSLNFNWRLIMAPLPVIDYIVVHELCHLTHMDHSPRFWNLVASILPEYKKEQNWLKEYEAILHL